MSRKKKMYTNYDVAVHWLNNHYILCNDIPNVDESVIENMSGLEDGADVYQFFLSDCSEHDVEWLLEAFPDLVFSYSEKLGLYVLCVDHFGTCWDYVMTETTVEQAVRSQGEKK